MGSVPQIGLGILILGAVFIFGHYIQQTRQSVNVAQHESSADEGIQWQMSDQMDQLKSQLQQQANRPSPTEQVRDVWPEQMPVMQPPQSNENAFGPAAEDSPDQPTDVPKSDRPARDQRSLMDLLPPLAHHPTDANTTDTSSAQPGAAANSQPPRRPVSLPEDPIVAPDFSQLERDETAAFGRSQQPPPPALDQTPVEQILGSRVIAAGPEGTAKKETPPHDCADCGPSSTEQPTPTDFAGKQPSLLDSGAPKQPWLGNEYGPFQEVTRRGMRNVAPRENSPVMTAQRQPLPEKNLAPPRDLVSNNSKTLPNSKTVTNSKETATGEFNADRRDTFRKVRGLVTTVRSRQTRSVSLDTNEFRQHETKAGETLQQISQKYYGSPRYYLDIYLANQDVLTNPATVNRGTVLRIPSYRK